MVEVISEPREEVSPYAPKMYRIQIHPDQIGLLIGPGGKTVRKIQEEAAARQSTSKRTERSLSAGSTKRSHARPSR